jgi:hypothetical protein
MAAAVTSAVLREANVWHRGRQKTAALAAFLTAFTACWKNLAKKTSAVGCETKAGASFGGCESLRL